MGGDIEVFSDGKTGSTFRFTVTLTPIKSHLDIQNPDTLNNLSKNEMDELRKRDLGIHTSSKKLLTSLVNRQVQGPPRTNNMPFSQDHGIVEETKNQVQGSCNPKPDGRLIREAPESAGMGKNVD